MGRFLRRPTARPPANKLLQTTATGSRTPRKPPARFSPARLRLVGLTTRVGLKGAGVSANPDDASREARRASARANGEAVSRHRSERSERGAQRARGRPQGDRESLERRAKRAVRVPGVLRAGRDRRSRWKPAVGRRRSEQNLERRAQASLSVAERTEGFLYRYYSPSYASRDTLVALRHAFATATGTLAHDRSLPQ